MSEAIKSLIKAQDEMGTPHKDSVNPHFKNKYASLQSVFKAVMPALQANGFALVQRAGKDDLGHFVETSFHHVTGQSFESRVYLIIDKNNMQGFGSAMTYAKRYGLLGLAGIEPDEDASDDDGNKASNPPAKKPQNPKPSASQMRDGMISWIKSKNPELLRDKENELESKIFALEQMDKPKGLEVRQALKLAIGE